MRKKQFRWERIHSEFHRRGKKIYIGIPPEGSLSSLPSPRLWENEAKRSNVMRKNEKKCTLENQQSKVDTTGGGAQDTKREQERPGTRKRKAGKKRKGTPYNGYTPQHRTLMKTRKDKWKKSTPSNTKQQQLLQPDSLPLSLL